MRRIPITDALGRSGSPDIYAGYDERIKLGLANVRATAEPVRQLDPVTLDLARLRTAELDGCHT
jgi:hypothetical protein